MEITDAIQILLDDSESVVEAEAAWQDLFKSNYSLTDRIPDAMKAFLNKKNCREPRN